MHSEFPQPATRKCAGCGEEKIIALEFREGKDAKRCQNCRIQAYRQWQDKKTDSAIKPNPKWAWKNREFSIKSKKINIIDSLLKGETRH